jgi:hypothetical protein
MGMLTDWNVVPFVIKRATQRNVESVGERQIRHTPGDKAPVFWRIRERASKYLFKQAAISQSSLAVFLFCGLSGCYPAGFGDLAAAAEGEGAVGDVFGDAAAGGDVGA